MSAFLPALEKNLKLKEREKWSQHHQHTAGNKQKKKNLVMAIMT